MLPELRFAKRLNARGVKLDFDTAITVLEAFHETLEEERYARSGSGDGMTDQEADSIRAQLEASHAAFEAGQSMDVAELRQYLKERREAAQRGKES